MDKECKSCGGKMPCPEHSKTGSIVKDIAKTVVKFKGGKGK